MSSTPPHPHEDDFTRPPGKADTPPLAGGYRAPERNPKATFSLVLGIVSIFCFGFILGIVAIVVGILARREIAAAGGLQGGSGFAIAGIVTGALGIVSGIAVASTGFQLDLADLF